MKNKTVYTLLLSDYEVSKLQDLIHYKVFNNPPINDYDKVDWEVFTNTIDNLYYYKKTTLLLTQAGLQWLDFIINSAIKNSDEIDEIKELNILKNKIDELYGNKS